VGELTVSIRAIAALKEIDATIDAQDGAAPAPVSAVGGVGRGTPSTGGAGSLATGGPEGGGGGTVAALNIGLSSFRAVGKAAAALVSVQVSINLYTILVYLKAYVHG